MHYHENRLSDLRNETRGLHNYIRKYDHSFDLITNSQFSQFLIFKIQNPCRTE